MRLFPYGVKIYPKMNDNSTMTRNLRVGNEVRKTEDSKKELAGFNNKFVGYKDASQLTRLRASMQVSKQVEHTDPNKKQYPREVNDALRRNRNGSSIVPPKVRNKQFTCNKI
jgi:hypothetical protein